MGKRKLKVFCLEVYDLLAFFILTIWIILCVRFFLFTPYTVIGASMSPTFENKDWIIVEKMTKHLSSFERGDIIVFVPPKKNIPYIKRVIGLPGDTVLVQNDKVYICSPDITITSVVHSSDGLNCEILDEYYLPEGRGTKATCGKSEFKVEGGYFAMGDNRGHTTDSLCCFGIQCTESSNYLVPTEYILGKVAVRLFPHYDVF